MMTEHVVPFLPQLVLHQLVPLQRPALLLDKTPKFIEPLLRVVEP